MSRLSLLLPWKWKTSTILKATAIALVFCAAVSTYAAVRSLSNTDRIKATAEATKNISANNGKIGTRVEHIASDIQLQGDRIGRVLKVAADISAGRSTPEQLAAQKALIANLVHEFGCVEQKNFQRVLDAIGKSVPPLRGIVFVAPDCGTPR